MKKLIVIAFILLLGRCYAAIPPENILKIFNETYTKAEQPVWSEHDTFFQVFFKQGDVSIRINYAGNAEIISTIRYYKESHLPPYVLGSLKKKHSDKKVFGVTELSTATTLHYFINLEDDSSWYKVKTDAYGVIERIEKLHKIK